MLRRLLREKYVAGVDIENGIVYLRKEHISNTHLRHLEKMGFSAFSVGDIIPVDYEYIVPRGCSPPFIKKSITTTALHCISFDLEHVSSEVELVKLREGSIETEKYKAEVAFYTRLKKCGLLCKLLGFFLGIERFVNKRELATLIFKDQVDDQTLLDGEPIGVISFGSTDGRLMAFSPFPDVEYEKGNTIKYLSYDYYVKKYVITSTTIRGHIYFIHNDYIFKLPYAFELERVIVKPGYSGSTIFKV
jgi:hypothetical protein